MDKKYIILGLLLSSFAIFIIIQINIDSYNNNMEKKMKINNSNIIPTTEVITFD